MKASGFLAQCPLLGSKYLILKNQQSLCTMLFFWRARQKSKTTVYPELEF